MPMKINLFITYMIKYAILYCAIMLLVCYVFQGAFFIFISFGVTEPFLISRKKSSFGEDGARHIHCFHMKSLNETGTPIFILLFVQCFQGQPLGRP